MRKKLEITERELGKFAGYLRREEREASTIESYMRAADRFAAWLDGRVVTKELTAAWKAQLLEQGYRPVSVNVMLAAVNKLLVCMGSGRTARCGTSSSSGRCSANQSGS